MSARLLRILGPLVVIALVTWGIRSRSPAEQGDDDGDRPSPQQVAQRFRQTEEDLTAGDFESALDGALWLVELVPDDYTYLEALARALGGLGQYEAEAAALEQVLLVAPRPTDACPQIGIAYQRAGLQDAALEALERCAKLVPEDADTLFFLALAHERLERLSEARDLYEHGLRQEPDYPDMKMGLARLALLEGRLGEACALLESVVARWPRRLDARIALAGALREKGDLESAMQRLLAADDSARESGEYLVLLAYIAADLGETEQAIRSLESALELDPDDRRARSRLAELVESRP